MNYHLEGHDYRHAAEEMLLHLLPAEIPAAVELLPEEGDRCLSKLTTQDGVSRAVASVIWDGRRRECARTCDIAGCDALERRRRESEIVRLSIYDAIVPLLPQPPEWGSLTGVRPAKLARSMMERGLSNAQVARELRERYSVSTERAALTIRAAAIARDLQQGLGEKELSLYVGIPFCPSRCAYCSFVSASVDRAGALIAPYLDALCAEAEMTGELLKKHGWKVKSLYIGGGTPTTLSAAQLTRLMETLRQNIDLTGLSEYTVEAGRPDTITAEKLHALRAGGASRISINPQTMNDEVLARIGRKHSAAQVLQSYALAREIGFSVINMDTIAGLDGDTPASFHQTIDTLVGLEPENITVHTLAIKRAADLSDKQANAQKRAAVGEMLDGASSRLTNAGYAPYYLYRQKFTAGGFENVGWCKPRTESHYNVYMMEELQTIVSLGAGAISKSVTGHGRITRYANPKYPTEYLTAEDRIRAAREKLLAGDGTKGEGL